MGDVSDAGFEALALSIEGARRIFPAGTRFCVYVNTLSVDQARRRAGPVAAEVQWREATHAVPDWLAPHLDEGFAEGVAWKLVPPRAFPEEHELAIDNDVILWSLPDAVARWLAEDDSCLLAEDVRGCFGRFAPLCGDAPRNLGIRGLPPRFHLEGALRAVLRRHPGKLASELDEQGLQVAALAASGAAGGAAARCEHLLAVPAAHRGAGHVRRAFLRHQREEARLEHGRAAGRGAPARALGAPEAGGHRARDGRDMLTVLNVAYPFAPVTPDAVGGAEQILSAMDRAVVRAGHRSLVLGVEGSRSEGRLFCVPRPEGPLTPELQAEARADYQAEIDRLVASEKVDVVHLHGADFHAYLPEARVPVLGTLHLPQEWYPRALFEVNRQHTWLNCVSGSQRRRCPPSAILLEDVPNGVDLSRLRPAARAGDYVLVLGRICPEKGIHVALDAALRANVPLVLAGEVFPYPKHLAYFDVEVRPRLDARRRFIGAAGFDRKVELLRRARCLLVPSMVPETSSLVTLEALACGTPVIAFPNGALADLIEDGKTGFLVRDFSEMVDAIRRAAKLDRPGCRAAAERFSEDTMCERYLSIYQKIALECHAGIGRA